MATYNLCDMINGPLDSYPTLEKAGAALEEFVGEHFQEAKAHLLELAQMHKSGEKHLPTAYEDWDNPKYAWQIINGRDVDEVTRDSLLAFYEVTVENEFEFGWDDYVVGYVVTNINNGEQANMQFDYNPAAPKSQWGFSFGCEGDNTYENFTELEREAAYEEAQEVEGLRNLEKHLVAIYEDSLLKEKLEVLIANSNSGVSISDIENIAKGL